MGQRDDCRHDIPLLHDYRPADVGLEVRPRRAERRLAEPHDAKPREISSRSASSPLTPSLQTLDAHKRVERQRDLVLFEIRP